jgi:RNA polymerase sigma-70 factor, ECF subfamily
MCIVARESLEECTAMAIHKDLLTLQPQLTAYARAICGSADEADDLVQDAIARTLATDSAPADIDNLRPWMFRVIRNLHVDGRRRAKVRTEYFTHQERSIARAPADADDPLSRMLVRTIFDSLSPDRREVLFLVDIVGLRYAEAAGVLEVAPGTVMSRLNRARRAMLERLEGSNVAPLNHRRQRSS